MPQNPVILVHGYSDQGPSFKPWADQLASHGYPGTYHTCTYRSLVNHLTIKDIAEGFERALSAKIGPDQPFDAIVHSTGMLVIRSWLIANKTRLRRLKRLIGLAPATFGSPLAQPGRSFIGALVRGNKDLGPDFLSAGAQVLDGLELASRLTWDLSQQDLFGGMSYYGPEEHSPYVFIFVGKEAYSGLRSAVNRPGTDGTVRWSGCSLTSRKVILDFTQPESGSQHIEIQNWTHEDMPALFVDKVNHGTILSDPPPELVAAVVGILSEVRDDASFQNQRDLLTKRFAPDGLDQWQQFVVHAVDERGDGIADYNIELYAEGQSLAEFEMDVDTYSGDHSFRCFHVNLSRLKPDSLQSLGLRLIAATGSLYVGYRGYQGKALLHEAEGAKPQEGMWMGELDLTPLVREGVAPVEGEKGEVKKDKVKFFCPYTTTLIELRLDRQPLPLDDPNGVCWF